ncbi:MAG: MoxR family ATPase [Spirochaetales bacterium]|nr:MoxR family ATPase [Spirochaetales bacterium]
MARQDTRPLLGKVNVLRDNIGTVFVGNTGAVRSLCVGFFSGLHVLVEDIPGVGKTTLAKTLARSAGLDFARLQFTPDLLPGDVIGTTVWSAERHDFLFKPGAVMHQFILADEINRASARTQSALLEAMQEHAVSVDGTTHVLPEPFFVIATQNPLSFTGTFPLPEGQVDRFGVSFSLGYPPEPDERNILSRFQEEDPLQKLEPVMTPADVSEIRLAVRRVFADDKIKEYIVAIAGKTRSSSKVRLGMSPRGSQHLLLASQAAAFLEGRDFVSPEDVLGVADIVIPHRLHLRAEARLENASPAQVAREIVSKVKTPTGLER